MTVGAAAWLFVCRIGQPIAAQYVRDVTTAGFLVPTPDGAGLRAFAAAVAAAVREEEKKKNQKDARTPRDLLHVPVSVTRHCINLSIMPE